MSTKVVSSTNSKNQLIVSINDTKYTFNQPLGRDLATIERSLNKPDSTEAENLAVVMATLSDLSEDEYLDLPLGVFKAVGVVVVEYFRLASE